MPDQLPRTGGPILSAMLLMVCTLARADHRLAFADNQLETLTDQMSPEGYHQVYRRNQRMLRKTVKSYTTGTLRAVGMPEPGIRLMGVAAWRWAMIRTRTLPGAKARAWRWSSGTLLRAIAVRCWSYA